MKTLDEKKKLAKFARGFGQPDLALEESIRREEELEARLFAKPAEPVIPILKEELPPPPAPAVEIPKKEDLISQTMNAISNPKFSKPPMPDLQAAEIKAIRREIAELVQKMGTLSWGGGGTGIVRLWNADDLDRNSAGNGKYLKFQNGWFVFDDLTLGDVVNNTTLVTTPTYTVVDADYYIGVNVASTVTITLPAATTTGRELVIKDESGNCENNIITVSGTVDNDATGFDLAINNGAIHMLYRGGSWRIV